MTMLCENEDGKCTAMKDNQWHPHTRTPLKRFALFMGDHYYPRGGWQDFKGTYETLVEALKENRSGSDWYHVVDLQTGEKIA